MKHNLCILLLFISIYPVFGATTAENDTLLRVLREELAADFAELQQQDVKPYFMSFRVQETHRAISAFVSSLLRYVLALPSWTTSSSILRARSALFSYL